MKPSYYSVLPADVRYADIPANCKLLYAEITSLTQREGHCWATDGYFAKLYGVTNETANRWVARLKKEGLIDITYDIKPHGRKRVIWVGGIDEKIKTHIDEKINYNNTSNEYIDNKLSIGDTSPKGIVKYGNHDINWAMDEWERVVGFKIQSRIKPNRNAVGNLLKRYGRSELTRLLIGVSATLDDRYAPSISDYVTLQAKLNELIVWGRKRGQGGVVEI